MPSTSRVVQAAPGPTPTNTAAAPCSIRAKAASALVVLPTATGMGMKRVNSSSESGSYSVARWRALLTWDWTRNRSAPCSAQNGPNLRAAPGVAATAAFDPAAWISSSRGRRGPRGPAAGRPRRAGSGRRRPARPRSGRAARPGRRSASGRLRGSGRPGRPAGASAPAKPGVDDGVHRGGEDRDGELDAGEGLGRGRRRPARSCRCPGASETSSKPYVGRIVSTFEWKTRRWAAEAEIRLGPVDHVALLCRLTVGCRLAPSLPAAPPGRRASPQALSVELEPRAPRSGSATSRSDPLDRRRDTAARPSADRLVAGDPLESSCSCDSAGSASGSDPDGEDDAR